MPEIFRAGSGRAARVISGPKRTSPRKRGYDARWDRRSARYRRAHPFCENPVHGDRVVFGELVDHKMPVADGGAVHCPDEGLWTLCLACHGWKAALEEHARQSGEMDRIVAWRDEPGGRPIIRLGDARA